MDFSSTVKLLGIIRIRLQIYIHKVYLPGDDLSPGP